MSNFTLFCLTFVGSLVLYGLFDAVIFGPLAKNLSWRHETVKRTGDCRDGCRGCLLVSQE
jgi:hypothetical protein